MTASLLWVTIGSNAAIVAAFAWGQWYLRCRDPRCKEHGHRG